jgi:hypothetical protein
MWEGDAAGSDLRSANHDHIDLLRLHRAWLWQILVRLQFPTDITRSPAIWEQAAWVYPAKDAKLGRSVAIKLLPEAFTHDSDRAVFGKSPCCSQEITRGLYRGSRLGALIGRCHCEGFIVPIGDTRSKSATRVTSQIRKRQTVRSRTIHLQSIYEHAYAAPHW